MSMTSALIDKLRKSADEWNGSNMFELARMCSDAADTIWQLRDDLQRTHGLLEDAEHDESRAWDRVRKAEDEADKLRELVRELWEGYADPPCEDCPLKDKPACVDCPICAREAAVIDRMRELGVEVDE